MTNSISVEQLQEQQQQLLQTVNNLISQKSQLEDQLENCKATLSSNQGALQYANALIKSCDESTDVDNVGAGNVAEEIDAVLVDDAAVEEVEL